MVLLENTAFCCFLTLLFSKLEPLSLEKTVLEILTEGYTLLTLNLELKILNEDLVHYWQ